MADLEKEKDLEEDEFKMNVKPSTSREMTIRICKSDVNYQFDESDHDESDLDESDHDGYSSPDIDYEEVANYEQNSTESTKIHAEHKDQENESQQNVDYYSDKSDDLYNYDPGCDYE